MSAIQNKYLAMRYFNEIMNECNLATIYEILASNFIFTLPTHPDPYHGPDGFKEVVTMLHSCFPDFHMDVQDMVASGDTVVTHWRGSGTHLGAAIVTVMGDIPASGRKFEIDGITWHHMENGKIVESLGNEDTVGFLTQLGIIPSSLTTTTSEHKLNITHRYFYEVMGEGKLEIIEEIMVPDVQLLIPTQPAPVEGYENIKDFVYHIRNAFPDIKFTIEREIASDNKVATRWLMTGTHKGEFLGQPATGNSVTDYGVDIFTFENGTIQTIHVNENAFGLLNQLKPKS